MVKKIAAVLLILGLCLCLAGCTKTDTSISSDTLAGSISSFLSDMSPSVSSSLPSSKGTSTNSQPANTRPAEINTEVLMNLDNTKKGWGQGVNVDEYNRPTGALQYQTKYGKYDAYFIKEKTKTIYLTFDEGYENGYTASILDTLKAKNVHAVFFVTYDYVKSQPDLVKRMIAEGHAVGNHSWSHPSMPTLSVDDAAQEIAKLHDYVKKEFGYTMTLFRPPMGEFSERTLALTQELGYKSVFWSFAYVDWDTSNQKGSEFAYNKITSAEHEGAIYLLHAVSKDNAAALGSVIDHMRNSGFTLGTL